jgi:translation initiation factor 1A
MANIRGSIRKVWIVVGDVVLTSKRDFQDSKCDIVLKYTIDESRLLKNYGEFQQEQELDDTRNPSIT